jgi:hypothetical protein
MSLSIDRMTRESVYSLYIQGISKVEISQRTQVSYKSVLTLCKRFKAKGALGIETSYSNSGCKSTEKMLFYKRVCLWLKRLHIEWGAPIIRVILTKRYGVGDLPSIRRIQDWFTITGATKPRQRLGQQSIGRSLAEHNIWQVDAKERFILASSEVGNYLNIVDEFSGAWLEAPLFPL